MTSGFSGEMMKKEITKISIHPLIKMSVIVEVNMVEGMQVSNHTGNRLVLSLPR